MVKKDGVLLCKAATIGRAIGFSVKDKQAIRLAHYLLTKNTLQLHFNLNYNPIWWFT